MLSTIKAYATAIGAVLAFAAGIAISIYVYANPRIHALEAQIDRIKADDAKATAQFMLEAQRKQREMDDAIAAAQQRFEQTQADNLKRTGDLRSRVGVLNAAIDAFASRNDCQLSATAAVAGGVEGRSQVLGSLLDECTNLLGEGAGDSLTAAALIRRLQAAQ